ncbi:hypothetical protein DIPPA_10957 [Diplonema papillatum]|nr:hypothetical protein DIPPA_10957 [Diplonema papillatum]
MAGFLSWSMWLVLNNATSIEYASWPSGGSSSAYDAGSRKKNLQAVFGRYQSIAEFLVPSPCPVDAHGFALVPEAQHRVASALQASATCAS